jgi:hypothetical protein
MEINVLVPWFVSHESSHCSLTKPDRNAYCFISCMFSWGTNHDKVMVMAKAEIFISVLMGGAIEIAYFNLSFFIIYFNPYKLPRLHEFPRAS